MLLVNGMVLMAVLVLVGLLAVDMPDSQVVILLLGQVVQVVRRILRQVVVVVAVADMVLAQQVARLVSMARQEQHL
jgi:hypothetical protein